MLSKTKKLETVIEDINQLETNKFRLLLTRILDKIDEKEVFTQDEESKLKGILGITDESKIKDIIWVLKDLLLEIVYHCLKPKALVAQLVDLGFVEEKVATIASVWLKNGGKVVARLKDKSFNVASKQLDDVNWKVFLHASQETMSELKIMKAQIDLTLRRESESQDNEQVSLEFDHKELSSLYSQLESVQNKLDGLLK